MKLPEALRLAFQLRPEDYRAMAIKIAEAAGTTLDELRERDRARRPYVVRVIIAETLREEGATLNEIGLILNRDHTTVLHMLKRGHLDTDVQLPMLEVLQ